jgi:hypothetical protein
VSKTFNRAFETKVLIPCEISNKFNIQGSYFLFFSHSQVLGCDRLHVGVIPNRYTSDVVLNQQARVAHQGWYGGFVIPGGPVAEARMAVLDAGAYGGSGDRPMADDLATS